ncbi:hypothetical protein FAI41_00480 [Acetobacteraceae bacterium]|nr:hypothetical protein FAI41_00480 [Acetobacteraceae bacterium]
MKFSSYCLLGTSFLFLFTASFSAHAASEIIPSLGRKCFIFESKSKQIPEDYHLEESQFSATLVGTGLSLTVEKLHLSDSEKKMTTNDLSQINALSAYLALSGYYHGISPNCPGLPYKELMTISGTSPAAEWENIKMDRPIDLMTKNGLHQKIFIKHLDIHALQDPKEGIRGIFEAKGITGDNAPLTPKKASGDFTFTPNVSPPYKIIVRKMEGLVGESQVSGQGYVLAGEDIAHSKSKAHLSIGKIGSLIEQASSSLGPRATAALLVARLMSHRENDEKISWDIELDNGASKVNGINIPYFVH